jgi:kinesin family protein C2/C3
MAEPPPGHSTEQQQLRDDLGFGEEVPVSPAGCGNSDERDDKIKELSTQIEGLQKNLQAAKAVESSSAQKLQSMQQINRSQCALMKAELLKTRRKLCHTQAVCARQKEQIDALMEQSPALTVPAHLASYPTEEEAVEESAELAVLHQRWESDILQLQAEFEGGAAVKEVQEARQRVAELEAALGSNRKAEAVAATAAGQSGTDVAALRKELEAEQDKAKDQMKKMKQLAVAYKKLDAEKGDLQARLAEAEQQGPESKTSAKASAKGAVSPALAAKIQQQLAASRAEIAELKASVSKDLKLQMPALIEEAMRANTPELMKLIDNGAKEWRDKYAIECEKRRKLHNLVQELKGNIRVHCRVRPMSIHDSRSCLAFPGPDEIQIRDDDRNLKKTWQFNEVFREDSTQEMVFTAVRDLVVSMIDGFNVCIFAYGQTGSGKTHSMQGTKADPGVYMRTFTELFKVAKDRKGWVVDLKVALIEIYNDEIRDLLVPKGKKVEKLQIRQGKEGNYVPGLIMQPATCAGDVEAILERGQENRTVACTDMNEHSSRSHLLLQIHGSMTTSEGKTMSSQITLVDLAGSERMAKSGVQGDRAKEAIAINKSLSALGDVINSRATKSSHTPFRNSTLTHLLQDSLSGDSKTLMLLQINPCQEHVEESMCSLGFGARVNNVEMTTKK